MRIFIRCAVLATLAAVTFGCGSKMRTESTTHTDKATESTRNDKARKRRRKRKRPGTPKRVSCNRAGTTCCSLQCRPIPSV